MRLYILPLPKATIKNSYKLLKLCKYALKKEVSILRKFRFYVYFADDQKIRKIETLLYYLRKFLKVDVGIESDPFGVGWGACMHAFTL